MRALKIAGLGAVAAASLFIAMSATGALAQTYKYSTGLVMTPPEQLSKLPETPVYRDFLPPAVDLSKYMPPVGDQGAKGSCVGWATAYAARAYYAKQVEHRDTSDPANVPSPEWIFDIVHIGANCEQGADISQALAVFTSGALSLKEYPYDDKTCKVLLPPQRARAKDFKTAGYERVDNTNLDQVKAELAKGNPVVIGANLDDNFMNLEGRRGTQVWRSDKSQPNIGGHAITLVGYDDARQVFKFINQWTANWGDKGYGRMSYDTFLARVDEAFVIKMPGDPEVVLAPDDLVADQFEEPTIFAPPVLNVNPQVASRDILSVTDADVDVGALSCGKVDVVADTDGNKVAKGFVGTQAELDQVSEALKGKVDDNQVALAPWPACEVRLTLAAQLADTDGPQAVVDPQSPKVGDSMQIGVQSPGFASYVYATYFSADGTVLNLTQPTSADLKAKAAHTQLKFGDSTSGQMVLTVSKPVGDEMLLVVASEKPLFAEAQPDSQTDRQFLSSLRSAVLAGDTGRVTATLLPVTTVD
jgi:hypothetical protein